MQKSQEEQEILDFNLYLIGKINEETTSVFIPDLFSVAETILGLFPDKKNRPPISITINTYGGELTEMFAIYDSIKRVQSMDIEVQTIGLGKVMSSGLVLIAAGSKGLRTSGRWTRFLLHEAHCTMQGSILEMTAQKKEIDFMQEQYLKALSSETIKPTSFYKKIINKQNEYYFSVSEALEWGLIDAIEE